MDTKEYVDQIEVPQPGSESHLFIGDYILFIRTDYSEGEPNPCEDQDGIGTIRSLNTRHVNSITPDEMNNILNNDEDAVILSYFEHGQSLWFVKDSTAPAGVEFQWDGVGVAGIWIPDDCVRESYTGQDGLSRRDWMVKQAAAACEAYTQWCNGEVYSYSVELYRKREEDGYLFDELTDYRFADPVYEDSCCGFYGWDYFEDEVLSTAKYAVEKALK
jgi:hypothetical protein